MLTKLKLKFKFLVKIKKPSDETIKITKLSTILNQLNIDESNQLDDILKNFFSQNLILGNFSSNIFLTVWKNNLKYSFFSISPINLEFFFKNFSIKFPMLTPFFFNNNFYSYEEISLLKDLNKHFWFTLFFSHGYSLNSDLGFFYNLKKSLSSKYSFFGYFKTYIFREKMLGRKNNFRQKVKKLKFEDY